MGRRRGVWLAATAIASVVMTPVAGGQVGTAAAARRCPVYAEHVVAKGLRILESLLPDGRQRVMFPTGDNSVAGALSLATGTLRRLNLRTGKLTTYATGLTMPNGLVIGPNGGAYVTRDVGLGTGITRISAASPHHVTVNWAKIADTNGIAIDPSHHEMYVDRTFTAAAPVDRISLRNPGRITRVADLSGLGPAPIEGLDDLVRASNGVLYLPANVGGELFRFDPRSRTACLVATGLGNPSDVAIGTGDGWRKGALFVSGFDGTVREFARK